MKIEKISIMVSRALSIIFAILYIGIIILNILGIMLIFDIVNEVNFSSNTNQSQLRFCITFPHIALIIIFPITGFYILRAITKGYCFNCRKIIHPIFRNHKCNVSTSELEKRNLNAIYKLSKEDLPYIDKIVEGLKKLNIIRNEREDSIIWYDFMTLNALELTNNYKLPLILMGSILEFVLKRYCRNRNIQPEDFVDSKGNKHPGDSFSNYLQSAINNNLFGQKNSWLIAQNNLRELRNYVHLENQMTKEYIDKEWIESIKPAFYRILKNMTQSYE